MKKILLLAAALGATNLISAQCTTADNGVYPEYTLTPVCNNTEYKVAEYAFTSEYSKITVTEGTEYDFINKNYNGGTFGYVTITDEAGSNILSHGIGKVKWTADKNRVIRFYSHVNGTECNKEDWGASFDRIVICNKPITEYCKPILDCSNGAVIKNVSIADFSKSTECSPNGYADYTSDIITLTKGTDYNLNVEIGYGWYQQSVSMWIDYNNNFEFDQNEFIYIGQQNDGPGIVSKTISIPSTVADGNYRMRIRLTTTPQANANWSKSCNSADVYGETEDYTVKIVSLSLATNDVKTSDVKVSPNPVTDYLNISTDKEISEITVTNTNGQIVKKFRSVSKLDLKSLVSGVYIINIKQKDGQTVSKKIIKK